MSNNKARLFQLYRYLYENTDDRHYVSTQQILQDIRGDRETYSRNTVPSDIKELQDEGYNIVRVESSGNLYYLGSREFEPQELRLLIDAVAASQAKYDRPQDLYFTADVTVGDTPTFYAWVFQFGGAIKILGPENVVERYQEMLQGQID